MRVVFLHGFAGALADAARNGILGRDVAFYSAMSRAGFACDVITTDDCVCSALKERAIPHWPLSEGLSDASTLRRVAVLRSRLRRVIGRLSPDAIVMDVTAAPLLSQQFGSTPTYVRLEWDWAGVSRAEDGRLETTAKRALQKRALRCSSAVVAATDALAAEARSAGASRIFTIPVFVDDAFFADVEATRGSSHKPYFVCVGRQVAIKRFATALEALSVASVPHGTSLMLIGAGPEHDTLRRMAAELGVDVRFLGRVPNSEVAQAIREATALLHPSVNEGMPRAVMEAMASGTLVAAGRSQGAVELLSSGSETRGIVVGESVSEWASVISAIANSPSSHYSVAVQAAREWARRHVSLDVCAASFAELLRSDRL